jgi:hypothetical protein
MYRHPEGVSILHVDHVNSPIQNMNSSFQTNNELNLSDIVIREPNNPDNP